MYKTYLPIVATNPFTNIHIVYVNTPTETLNGEYCFQQIQRGMQYWVDLAPGKPLFKIIKETTIVRNDPFSKYTWLREYTTPGAKTIVIIANEQSRNFVNLGGNYLAPAWNDPKGDMFYSTTHTKEPYGKPEWTDFLGMAVAHELGHILWDLPDRFGEFDIPINSGPSIMQFPAEAYRAWTIHDHDVRDIHDVYNRSARNTHSVSATNKSVSNADRVCFHGFSTE